MSPCFTHLNSFAFSEQCDVQALALAMISVPVQAVLYNVEDHNLFIYTSIPTHCTSSAPNTFSLSDLESIPLHLRRVVEPEFSLETNDIFSEVVFVWMPLKPPFVEITQQSDIIPSSVAG